MKGVINLDGYNSAYEIKTNKRARRLIVRVDLEGVVRITAPPRFSTRFIERYLTDASDYILKSVRENERLKTSQPSLLNYTDGERFTLFGNIVKLSVFTAKSQSVFLDGDCLIVAVGDGCSEKTLKRAVNEFLRSEVRRVVSAFAEKCYREMEIASAFPKIVYKNAVSRWGRNTPSKNELMFNYALYAAPLESIEYVVYHEFAHFFEFNHSQKFYEIIARYIPDWKSRRAKLKNLRLSGKNYYI